MEKSSSLQTLQKKMADKEIDKTDYAAYFKEVMLDVSKVYFDKPSKNFLAAVEVWAINLGRHRLRYQPNRPGREPVSDDSEAYCYTLWMELDGSQTKAAIKKRGEDVMHALIIEQVPLGWNGLNDDEQRALRYTTLRICMMRPSHGGFGHDARWASVKVSGAIPKLLAQSWEKAQKPANAYIGRSEVFLQDAQRLASEYESKRVAGLKTNPYDPFGDIAKQKSDTAQKPKGGEQTKRKAGEAVPGTLPYFPDDRKATDILKKQEPRGVSTLPQFSPKPSSMKGQGPPKSK